MTGRKIPDYLFTFFSFLFLISFSLRVQCLCYTVTSRLPKNCPSDNDIYINMQCARVTKSTTKESTQMWQKESTIFCDDWHDNQKELSFTLIKQVHPSAWRVLFWRYPVKLQMWGILFETWVPNKTQFSDIHSFLKWKLVSLLCGGGMEYVAFPVFYLWPCKVIIVLLLM